MPEPVSRAPSGPKSRPAPKRTASGGLRRAVLMLALALLGAEVVRSQIAAAPSRPEVDDSLFYEWAQEGKVESVVIRGVEIDGTLRAPEAVNGKPTTVFHTIQPEGDPSLLPLLRDKKVRIAAAGPAGGSLLPLVASVLPWIVLLGFWIWAMRRSARMMSAAGPMGPMGDFLRSRSHRFERTEAHVTFAEVAGLASAKRDLEEVVRFLKEPGRFRRLGGKIPRGVLLIGPPGTGKTLLARAVAGESGVPFFSISGSEFIELFVGVGAARVRDLFAEAKKEAPAIVFIDEIDAVGRARGTGLGSGHDEREQTLNQLLSEMDGFDRDDRVIVIAATNRPDVLDPALLRPGRFDRHVVVERPERAARRAILDVHVRNKPLAPDVDLDALARDTPGFSGADLENLVNEAALHATRRAAESIAAVDFTDAYDRVVLGDPREAKLGADERKRVAVHESGHAVVARFSAEAAPVHRVTIIPRGMALGATQQTASEDRYIMTAPQMASRLQVLIAGYAAERLVFGHVSSGAENDLKEATRLATRMVAQYGMSEALGPVYFEHEAEHPFLGQRVALEGSTSEATRHAVEEEARKLLEAARAGADETLRAHRPELDRLMTALLERETVEGEDLLRALGGAKPAGRAATAVAAAVGLGR